jgi:hypothetical protein
MYAGSSVAARHLKKFSESNPFVLTLKVVQHTAREMAILTQIMKASNANRIGMVTTEDSAMARDLRPLKRERAAGSPGGQY